MPHAFDVDLTLAIMTRTSPFVAIHLFLNVQLFLTWLRFLAIN